MEQRPVPSIRAVQIVWLAILAGPVVFAAVIPFLLPPEGGGLGGAELGILQWIAVAVAVVNVAIAFVIRGKRFADAAEVEGDQRLAIYASAAILFIALLEGAILFGLVAWLVTGEALPAIAMVVVLYALAIANFPSRSQFDNLGH